MSRLADRLRGLPSTGALSGRASAAKEQVKAGAAGGHDTFGERLSAGGHVVRKGIVTWANTPGERVGRWFGVIVGGIVTVPVALSDLRFLALAAIGVVGSCWWFGKPGREFPTQPAAVRPPEGEQWAGLVPQLEGTDRPEPLLVVATPQDDDPFPLAMARSPEQVAEAVSRAVRAEGIKLAAVEHPDARDWGKEVGVVQASGTPADLLAKAGNIETRLGLGENCFLVTPDRRMRARSTLRLLERDPFENMPPAPYLTPGSVSIRDAHPLAMRMDSVEYRLSLLGLHGILVASSGGAKSSIIRRLADITTASPDAVTWDFDGAGPGLDCYGDAIGRRARKPGEITEMLADALRFAQARKAGTSELGMGDTWDLAAGAALFLFGDEFAQLPVEAKRLAVKIWEVGRAGRVHLFAGSQEGTQATWGDAIANSIRLRILGPCRGEDIPLILGAGAKAGGWRPDRLHAGDEHDPADAGKAYVYGPGARDPLIYKFPLISYADAQRRGRERAAAGMPQLDEWSLRRAGVRLTPGGGALSLAERVAGSEDENAPLMAAVLDVFESYTEDWLPTTEVLLPALTEAGRPVSANRLRIVLGPDAGKERRTWQGSTSKLAGYGRAGVEAAAERLVTGRI